MPEVIIRLRSKFDLGLTITSHGWANLEPFEWCNQRETLRWRVRFGEMPCELRVHQATQTSLAVQVDAAVETSVVEACVRRVLMLDWDAAAAAKTAKRLDRNVASIISKGGGRLLRGSSAFEDIVKTICTINTNWRNTQSMVRGLVALSGERVFPSPTELLSVGEEGIKGCASVGYRARTILAVAELAICHDMDSIDLEILGGVSGLGPYAISHIKVLRGDYSTIPVDSEVRSYCALHLGLTELSEQGINGQFSDWGEFSFLGYKLGRIARAQNWTGD